MDKHIVELEVKLTYCEDLLEELNRSVFRQQQQIDQILKELQGLRDQVRASLPADPRDPAGEIPPHY